MAMVYMWETDKGKEWIEKNVLYGKFKNKLIGICIKDDSDLEKAIEKDELYDDFLYAWV